MKRGEIWWAEFGQGEGSEQSGSRPVLIIQNDVGNRFSPTVIVAAMTDSKKRWMPTHIKISRGCGIEKDSVIMVEQIRTIDKTRLSNRITTVPDYILTQVNHALGVSVGLVPAKEPFKR